MSNVLSKDLRNQLAKVTLEARECADQAVRAAIEHLAVHEKDYRPHMTVADRELRNRLRAKGRALGDERDARSGTQQIDHLVDQAAYEHWHRLLFARLLVENALLYSDDSFGGVPVTLKDCEELAPEVGARDGFDLACRFASRTLPGVFRQDDPILGLQLAPNDESGLRALAGSLPAEVFSSDDGLGWTYQFWQTQRNAEVRASGKSIGADELPAVTQFFTEDYMVKFLLHNTLGAWWAGKIGPIRAATEEEARARAALPIKDGIGITWTYLRFLQDERTKTWSPAAGTFSGWPKQARYITFLDPCMGSGHFLVIALPILSRMRMEEEGLSATQAVHDALRDNVFGLELDERCTQIAAFNVALTAWKLGCYQTLPPLNLACSGLAPNATEKDWISLAGDDDRLRRGMARLYALFTDAPVLGSLISSAHSGGDLIEADYEELWPLVGKALIQERKDEPANKRTTGALARVEMAVAAHGLSRAAAILARTFTLVSTNVPYLTEKRQAVTLKRYVQRRFGDSKADLATAFVSRCIELGGTGTVAVVSPMLWLFLRSYRALRQRLLVTTRFAVIARLGPNAFETSRNEAVNVSLLVLNVTSAPAKAVFASMDASMGMSPTAKSTALHSDPVVMLNQGVMRRNPDARITTDTPNASPLLGAYAVCMRGIVTGDTDRWSRKIWELPSVAKRWRYLQSTPPGTRMGNVDESRGNLPAFTGRENVIDWSNQGGDMLRPGTRNEAYGRRGVAVGQMGSLPVTVYSGELYDNNTAPIVPHDDDDLPALWAYCRDRAFFDEIRRIDSKMNVTSATFTKVHFDLHYWRRVAARTLPKGLPRPSSGDPTQWLFDGHPRGSDQPLHVSVARVLGYQWPRQTGSTFTDCPAVGPDGLQELADEDGIVCLPPINREPPAADRLRALLAMALGEVDERALLARAGPKGSRSTTLEDWLRDEYFEQHCALFHQRPFVWHIWDGRKDGFHALANYHKLDRTALQKLTYSYLGDWIRQQSEDAKADRPGAADRLGAAQALQAELAKILEGEPPCDIFVRWKPLSRQPLGWDPDLNDGVRMNIRPFMMAADVGKKGAALLRTKPNIKWGKDRGKEPVRDKEEFPWFWCREEPEPNCKGGKAFIGSRWNSAHLPLIIKRAARDR